MNLYPIETSIEGQAAMVIRAGLQFATIGRAIQSSLMRRERWNRQRKPSVDWLQVTCSIGWMTRRSTISKANSFTGLTTLILNSASSLCLGAPEKPFSMKMNKQKKSGNSSSDT